jgi:hypothetical protein
MEKFESHFIDSFILMNDFFHRHQIRYCLIGGIAAGFWGEPRFTKDMDFTVVSVTGAISATLNLLQKEKFVVEDKGSSQIQVIKKGALRFQADLILAETEYQDWLVQRAVPVEVFGVAVPICTAEDLIILKLIANRRQDLLDIENVLKRHASRLDGEYLKKWFSFWELNERFAKEFGSEPKYQINKLG